MIEQQASCEDEREPDLLSVTEARERIAAALIPLAETETVKLSDAFARVLATPIVASRDVPADDNSAMDGFALASASIPAAGEAELAVLGTAWAGRPFDGAVETGQAVRIFTGAVMPEGCDTVVIQERVAATEGSVRIASDVEAGRNVRAAGEDVAAGQLVLPQGRFLEAADIGVIASLGFSQVTVVRRPRVAFFTTGDELHALEDATTEPAMAQVAAHSTDRNAAMAPPGKLFDSNRYTLASMLAALGVELIDLGIVRDDAEATRAALQSAAECADVVVTSGGISAGDADFVTRAFHDLGDVAFWKIAMRPGRPLAFGHIAQAAFFGLPGNPVAVMVTFLEFVQPALRRLLGRNDIEPLNLPARSLSTLRKSAGRIEYQRGVMRVEDGEIVVESTGKQGAGRLSSMSRANCLIVIDADVAAVAPGDRVSVQPFRGLLAG